MLPGGGHRLAASIHGQVLVGTAHGRMGLFDLRGGKPEDPLFVYKGFAGAVRDAVVHPKHPLVFSVSLDRFLRVHHLTSRKLLYKEYMKSRLNCLLVRENLADIMPSIKKLAKRRIVTTEPEPMKEQKLDVNPKISDEDWKTLTE
ncbi:WD repeat-containing protein 74-like [Homarus americanus]|uniref:WD repeat-containing protein 74-like n=1 Tax=Homarus americanus TaxID=6706 RepID=A0A8J5MWS3_HOMAM|nr:WD repeat-containing protein 74-like [Homarus americanus]